MNPIVALEKLKVRGNWQNAPKGAILRIFNGAADGRGEALALKCESNDGGQIRHWVLGLSGDDAGILFPPGQILDECLDQSETYRPAMDIRPPAILGGQHHDEPGLVCYGSDEAIFVRAVHVPIMKGGRVYVTMQGPHLGDVFFQLREQPMVIGKIAVETRPDNVKWRVSI